MHKIFEGIEMVVFDIMGVIISNPSLVKKGLYPLYKDTYSYEYVRDLYDDVRANVDGDRALWNGLGVDDSVKARKEFLDTFELDENFETFRNLLNREGLRKGIISNMPEEWGDYLSQKFSLHRDFDPILLSSDIGVAKPDFGKYDEFLNRANVIGGKVLFIDDKLENLRMGKRFGFKTVLFDRGKEQSGYESDLVIENFEDLM
jgi:HAD superfamily hydrolase (TIGR01549 family)